MASGHDPADPEIVGLVGSIGSGCRYIADNVLQPKGYTVYSLASILKREYSDATGEDPKAAPRRSLQDFGDEMRRKNGDGYFAGQVVEEISKDYRKKRPRKSATPKYAVKSIRNPSEIHALRRFSASFYLFGVYADRETRWQRVQGEYSGDWGAFDKDDRNDTGADNPKHGQRVADCFYEADVVLPNEDQIAAVGNQDFHKLQGTIEQYLTLVENPLKNRQPLRAEEALMAMAYAASQQSSCLQRKVGAIIVDGSGNAISSGYNEVPKDEKPCRDEYNDCYRSKLRKEFYSLIDGVLASSDPPGENTRGSADLKEQFHKQFKIRNCPMKCGK